MSIVKMKRLRLIGMQDQREALLRQLQHMGCVEIDKLGERPDDPDWASLTRPDTEALNKAREVRSSMESALTTLKKYAPTQKTGLLTPRPVITEGQLFDDDTYQAGMADAEQLVALEQKISALRADQSKLKAQKLVLVPWLEVDIPLEMTSTAEVAVQFGTVASVTDFDELKGQLSTVTDLYEIVRAGSDSELSYLVFFCHRSVEAECQEILKQYGYSRAPLSGWTGTAAENDRRLDQKLADGEKELEAAIAQVAAFAPKASELEQCLDRADQEIAKEEARCRLLDSSTTFFMEGWFPASETDKLTRLFNAFDCAWELRDPLPEEYPQVPVKLKNNPLTRCLNVVTDMYSLPAYDGVDPNPLMAPFFIAFFGLMMADIGYGILMIVGALVVLTRSRPREGTRNFMELVLLCGISTLIVGAMTGGFFGDFIPQLLKVLDPSSTFVWFYPPLFTPLDNTLEILLGSMVLGGVQVVTGMIISVVRKIQCGEFIDALFDEITWWIILGGGAMAIFGIGTVSGVPVVLVVGGLMLIVGGTRNAKGFGKVTCLIGLVYNGVTGYFSDILSYMRIMALMLAGSVIAQVFNTLGSVFGNVIIFIIIAMIGNLLNLALNLLGCYVHNLRLQCLEYFNRFYKEGGKPYRPLNLKTKYFDILKEET